MNSKQAIFQELMPGYGSIVKAGQMVLVGLMAALLLVLPACAPVQPQPHASSTSRDISAPVDNNGAAEAVTGEPGETRPGGAATASGALIEEGGTLPVRFQQPSFFVKQMAAPEQEADMVVQVGADISTTTGPVPLRDIIKRLAALKNMNVSWASDVDQNVLLDVDIRADEDFFHALDNLLRQVDYFHEMQGNTIVIKYKETKKFHIAMPPRLTTVSSSNNIGGPAVTALSADVGANRWDAVRENLDQILDIWTAPPSAAAPVAAPAATGASPAPVAAASPAAAAPAAAAAPTAQAGQHTGKGYYSINESIGLITVTAPRLLLAKITDYIDSLKEELYRQVSIEAKIVEVILNDSSSSGLDWNDLLNDMPINVQLFDNTGIIYPRTGTKFISQVSIPPSFDVILDAISEQGETRVLSNPKVSVMNGQPAVIYVGDNITYIKEITTTIAGQSGSTSTSATTDRVMSGIRLEVYPTIINDKEVILSLTPMTTGLKGDIEYRDIGDGQQVGLPEVKERTMNSIVRVNSGEMLVIGGMIDRSDDTSGNKVNLLGDLPLINKLFKFTRKTAKSTELVILLRPQII